MRKSRLILRTNRRRDGAHVRPYLMLFFVSLALAAASLSMWMEDRYHKAAIAYRLYLAQHPLKPGEKPPRVDWLTDKIWR